MKFLLRSAVFIYCLLFLPDPVFAADHPPLPEIKGEALDAAAGQGDVLRKIVPKSEFFSSKRPLPPVSLPPDWDGLKKSPRKNSTKKKTHQPALKNRLGKKVAPLPERKGRTPKPPRTPDIITKVKPDGFEAEGRKERDKNLDLKNGGDKPGLYATIPLPIRRLEEPELIEPKGKINTREAAKVLQPDIEATPVVMPIPPPLTKWEDNEIASAQQNCKAVLKNIDVTLKPVAPIRKGACGTPAPVRVSAVGRHKGKGLVISPPATLNCDFTARFAKWVQNELQPLAMKHFKSRVKMVHNMASYSCRRRYNAANTKLSEHALANALDIGGMTLANGTVISLLKHWDDSDEKSEFLKEVHQSACDAFVVVLGPESNEAHKNHFHFDAGRYKVCE